MFFISQLGSVLTSFVIIVVGNVAAKEVAQVCAIVCQPHVKIENGPQLGLEIPQHRKNQPTDAHLDSRKARSFFFFLSGTSETWIYRTRYDI